MRFVSWNVNGFRACLNKGFENVFREADADAFCLQETKMQPGQADFAPEGWRSYFHSAVKKGYSGTAVFCKEEPLQVMTGVEGKHLDEGRVLTLEYPGYYLVTCYTPNAQDGLARIDYRMEFEDDFRAYLGRLKKEKPTIVCGDLNVAHEEMDLKNPKSNRGNAGFSDQERGKFGELLDSGFKDSFRFLHPDEIKYSWWSYRFRARQNNAGWRIDYFLVSDDAADRIKKAEIWNQYEGSDHCPVMLEIDL
ncbi:MAG: exodeoxyribonuclease III [Firmicutes bacterium]|nr:exodeoxyribonuclease III [Bacillota bacterium]